MCVLDQYLTSRACLVIKNIEGNPGKDSSKAKTQTDEPQRSVDCVALQHLLAELVGERIRLQMMLNQFAAKNSPEDGSDSPIEKDHSKNRRRLHMLQASVYNYETLLKEVKTQLVSEHQARVSAERQQQLVTMQSQSAGGGAAQTKQPQHHPPSQTRRRYQAYR